MILAIFASLLSISYAAISSDRVTSLPGYDGDLPSTHYSGYIPTGVKTGLAGYLHYWFIESENDPSTDPVVLWLNGGPGSSSLIGLLTENGQIATDQRSLDNRTDSGVPRVFYNPYSWNLNSSVIFLESPKGVGFSFCTDGSRSCVNTDESTAIDAHEFLVNWFESFSEFKANDFYITGESYAGVYIPMLIDQIQQNGQITNFKGAAIGNGCWGSDCFAGYNEEEINFQIFAGHALIAQTLEEKIDADCNFDKVSLQCANLLSQMNTQTGYFNVYNIYDECQRDTATQMTLREKRNRVAQNITVLNNARDSHTLNPSLSSGKLGGGLNDYQCGGMTAMDEWLSYPEVMSALHVNTSKSGMRYHKTVGDLRDLYKTLFQNTRILIYSGDTDACVPYWGTERWIRDYGFKVVNDWHAWQSNTLSNEGLVVAGYAIEYEYLQFITVKGSGHTVPTYKPVSALTMYLKFLQNKLF
jgi:carboxypeptidase C (cathepsin A)